MPEYKSIGVTPTTRELMPFARDFAQKRGVTIAHPFYEHVGDLHKILEVECACGSIIVVTAKYTPYQDEGKKFTGAKYSVEFIQANLRGFCSDTKDKLDIDGFERAAQ